MEGLNVNDVFQHYRLVSTEVEAVTYYLPRLISGETLHGAEKLIHHADVYGCEPKDLAAQFAPVPQAVSSGDRFFFTTCKRKKETAPVARAEPAAGPGPSVRPRSSSTRESRSARGRTCRSRRRASRTTGSWRSTDYCCRRPVADEEKVFCKIHLAQHPPDEARRESAAYKRQQRPEPAPQPEPAYKCQESVEPVPGPAPQPEHVGKRPAPGAAADPHPPRPKRMRLPSPSRHPPGATPSFAAAAPVSLPAESIPEADDDMGVGVESGGSRVGGPELVILAR